MHKKNKFLNWTNELNINVGIIDNQHKKLIDILNNLNELLFLKKYQDINIIVKELINYTNYHFDEEEKILKKINYSEYLNQRERHDKFRKELSKYIDIKNAENIQQECSKLLFLVQSWLIDHIKKIDKKSFSS